MPRRSKRSGISAAQIIGLAAGIGFILFVAAVVLFLLFSGGSPVDGAASRPRVSANSDLGLSDYLQNANALRGNAYRVEGRVEEQLKYSRIQGRLISFVVSDGSESSPLPVLVPPDFGHVNIEKGTSFQLVVEVGDSGLLVARDIKPN